VNAIGGLLFFAFFFYGLWTAWRRWLGFVIRRFKGQS
jgi:hypothetical protein